MTVACGHPVKGSPCILPPGHDGPCAWLAVDWGKGADWTVYRSAQGTHRRGEPCPAPVGMCFCHYD